MWSLCFFLFLYCSVCRNRNKFLSIVRVVFVQRKTLRVVTAVLWWGIFHPTILKRKFHSSSFLETAAALWNSLLFFFPKRYNLNIFKSIITYPRCPHKHYFQLLHSYHNCHSIIVYLEWLKPCIRKKIY